MLRNLAEKIMFRPLESAKKELARITARKASLEAQRQAKALELAAVERDSGIELLDSEDDVKALGRLAGVVARLRAESRVLDSAIALAESKLVVADRTVRVAEIADIRSQAATKRKHVDQLREATAPLLLKLSEIEAVKFSRAILLCERIGGWINIPTRMDLPADLRNGEETHPDLSGGFAMPLSRRELDEANELDVTARQLEAKLGREELRPLPEGPRHEPGQQVINTNPKYRQLAAAVNDHGR
jgi:hypothetical protein